MLNKKINLFKKKWQIIFLIAITVLILSWKKIDMNSPNIDLVNRLEVKIDRLVERYHTKKRENGMLKDEINRLAKLLEDKINSYSMLEKQFSKLKIAKTIESSSEDVHETKLRINQIVREIDKCIALLNR